MNAVAALRTPTLPPAEALSPFLNRALVISLAAYGLALPLTVAGTSILTAVLLLLAVAAGPALWRSRPWREPTMAIGLVLLAYAALHTLILDGWGPPALMAVNRYKQLLLAPLLFALFRLVSDRRWFAVGLLVGAGLYALVFWASLASPELAQALVLRRISAGFVFAVLAFLTFDHGRHATYPWLWRALSLFFAATVMFALDGRTGQVVLLVLVAWSAFVLSPPRRRLAALVAVALVAVGIAFGSDAVQRRIAETADALSQAPSEQTAGDEFSSTAIRIELLKHGLTLARENFLLGGGFLHYESLHQDAVRRAYAGDPQRSALADAYWARTENPHDEFIMQVVGGGLPALLLFLGWLAAPVLRRPPGRKGTLALPGLVLAFAVGCLFNSLLMDFVESHFYAAVLAWLLARESDGRAP